MKFKFLLWLLGWRLKWLSRRHEGFQKQLVKRDVVMQWGVKNGSVASWYHLNPNKVVARSGAHPTPTFSVTFEDANYAFDTIKAASKDQSVFVKGVNTGKIKIGGKDPGQVMWFFSLLKYIAP